jgi:hypothetical protein
MRYVKYWEFLERPNPDNSMLVAANNAVCGARPSTEMVISRVLLCRVSDLLHLSQQVQLFL